MTQVSESILPLRKTQMLCQALAYFGSFLAIVVILIMKQQMQDLFLSLYIHLSHSAFQISKS